MSILHTGWTPSPKATFEQELESVKELLESNPNNLYWQSRYSSLMEKIYGADWEQDAEAVHNLLYPVEEAYKAEKTYDCENCVEGVFYIHGKTEVECMCCSGNWRDCQNCHPEGTGNDDLRSDLLGL